jgi:hypothetical protein
MTPSTMPLRPAEMRPLLVDSLPWSPLDFLRGVSPRGDREVHFNSVLRDLDPADDLRFTGTVAPDLEVAVLAERLPWDSSFFGYEVARVHGVYPVGPGKYRPDADYKPALRVLIDRARERGIKYLFGVFDARDLPTVRALTELGFALIETRVHFHVAVREYAYPRRHRCRPATPADVEALVEMASTVDNPYDRFHSDPFIGRDHARRLIDRWIRASILEGFADVTMIPDSPTPGSLITLKYHDDKAAAWKCRVAQKMLAIAAPRVGNGWIHLVTETCYHAKERGFDHVFFTTQLANQRLMRTSQHAGYDAARGEYVFRMLL